MKYLVIGLGNFGSSIATELTDLGHEVIGIDSSQAVVEQFKDDITSTICMDCNDKHAINTLPLADIDVAIVCIGDDFGASILFTAILKKFKVKKIICRAKSVLHESVYQSLGVDDIVFPEKESAYRLAHRLQIKGVFDSYQADQTHFIIKATLPVAFDGLTIDEIAFHKYNLLFMGVLIIKKVENIFGVKNNKFFINELKAEPSAKLSKDDIIMVFGEKKDIYKFFQI